MQLLKLTILGIFILFQISLKAQVQRYLEVFGSGGRPGYIITGKTNGTENGILYRFNDYDGNDPSDLVQGSDGNFYGTCESGGLANGGTFFKIDQLGQFNKLKDFVGAEGTSPGNLTRGSDGNFYGMCTSGGQNNFGTIFKITPQGRLTKLKDLNRNDGAFPHGDLTQLDDTTFLGPCSGGGIYDYGTIFKITSTGTFTKLHDLSNSSNGKNPNGKIIKGNDESFYGICSFGGSEGGGIIFKVTLDGTFTKIYDFDTVGSLPSGSLVLGSDGSFYGMCTSGGGKDGGSVFKMTSSGIVTKLRGLDPEIDGGDPSGSLVQGLDGNFYGSTSSGGLNKRGTIFKITSNGVFTKLRDISAKLWYHPYGSLLLISDTITLANVTNVESPEMIENSTFEVYPNPSTGLINIKYSNANEKCIVYNYLGQEIDILKPGTAFIPKGLYLLKVSGIVKKVIIE